MRHKRLKWCKMTDEMHGVKLLELTKDSIDLLAMGTLGHSQDFICQRAGVLTTKCSSNIQHKVWQIALVEKSAASMDPVHTQGP